MNLALIDPDPVVGGLVKAQLKADASPEKADRLFIALDSYRESGPAGSYVLDEGPLTYLRDYFGKPVMFYGWPHRIWEAARLAKTPRPESGDSLQAALLRKLYQKLGDTEAFLLELPFDKPPCWDKWEQVKTLTTGDGRSVLLQGHLGSVSHALENARRNDADSALEHARRLLKGLQEYRRFLYNNEVESIESALGIGGVGLAPDEADWAECVTDTACGPVCDTVSAMLTQWQQQR